MPLPLAGENALALDHLTVTDATPSQLVELAAGAGCRAVCLFLERMDLLPLMPPFTLLGRSGEARETRARMRALGVELDLAYPFSLSARSKADDFRPSLEAAAWLGVKAVNVLHYDREPERRFESFAAFSALAGSFGLRVVLEFYPPSQVKSLAEALALVKRLNQPEQAGVNVDLLHLMRSGATLAELRAAPAGFVHYAQYCDAPLPGPAPGVRLDAEAGTGRLLPGDGGFDLAGFADALPRGIKASVELPRDEAARRGESKSARARQAVERTARILSV